MRINVPVQIYEPPSVPSDDRFKILLLKLDHIGDFLTAIKAFRIIRAAFPRADITLICLPSIVGLAESTGLFDRVKGFALVAESSKLGKVAEMEEQERVAGFQALLDGPYFLAADFKHDVFDSFGLDHVDAKVRAAFAGEGKKGVDIALQTMEWDVRTTDEWESRILPVHAEVRLTLLAHAIVESLTESKLDAAIFNTEQALSGDECYRSLKADKRMKIGVSLAAGSELRKWKTDYWTVLLHRLIQDFHAVPVFFGGPGDREETTNLTARLPMGGFVDLTGTPALAFLPAYMDVLDAYIGCDTGLTHLAGNLGLPTVNIYAGISNVSVWRTRGTRVRTVQAKVICAPCHLRFKEQCHNSNVCMEVLIPDIVYDCFHQVISLPGRR
jgi:ADP-heptose:LPS heptosyltransferase